MISELVGGAFLSAFLQVLFDRLASRQFIDFFRRRQFDHSLLHRLQTTLLTVNGVLSDAEEKQITNSFVKEWVDELKDAAYYAEDLLDEIVTMALECNVQAESSQARNTQVRSNLYTLNKIREDIEDRLENITRRLEYLTERKDVLGLVKESIGGKPSPRLPTTSLIDESEIYGRDADKEEILKSLLSGCANGNQIPVIAVVGMGGVGKTTLAQLLYNDSRVMMHFSRKVWVHVSEQSDVLRVSKTIYESITSRDCNITDLNLILVRLREKLARERFLIVLDDVWDENVIHWDALKNCFKAGASGSRILVTTRSQGVASSMRAIFSHHLRQLSDENCWLVFAKHAFRSDSTNASTKLKLIGEKIMQKCKGLPLAAKVLGSLLYSKVEVREWNKILNSKIWDLPSDKSKIIPSLRLSYYYLPSHLKQCFAYCSIFPKGYVFDKEKLVLLWMGEGFLQHPRSDHSKRTEEVGHEYIDELISRSLFEQLSNNKSLLIMHDLVNDLAQSVSGEFCFKFESGNQRCISEKARHFSCVIDRFHGIEKFEALHEVKYLRTFLPLSLSYPEGSHYLNKIVVEELLPTLTCLRVLSLANYTITQLPEGMFDDLIHVRYLDLSSTAIRKLPKSAGFLYNLHVLLLLKCYNLVELPENTHNLINLSHLDVTDTKLEEMPPEFGRLKNLQILTTFVVSKSSGSSLSELGRLLQLYGKLSIQELQNVRNVADAEQARLEDKENIKELVFTWKTSGHDTRKETDVLEKLRPHENLEKLTIEGYGGIKFPSWLGNSSFSNIIYLRLSGCNNCSSLPSLGQLSSLEELHINKMEGLESIGPEFYGYGSFSVSPFKSLQSLWFEDLPNWKHWSSFVANGQGFPSLQELHIRKCQHLTGSLPSSLPSLKLLHIYQCRRLRIQFQDMHYTELQTLHITSSCDSLTFFPLDLANKVENLQIQDCSQLRCIQVSKDLHQELKYLQDLEISDCDDLEFFSGRGMDTPNLASFSVSNCKNLRSMPEQMHTLLTLQALCISYCPKLESFPNGGLPPNLHSLLIENCDHLTPQKDWGLNKMASLTCLTIIGGCSNLKSFPEEGLLPASIISLQVGELPNLEILNLRGLQFLTSLKGLYINSCIRLHCLSEGRLPSSLSSLIITGCSLLSERCQVNQGEDWPKISHITNKVINGRVME
ncbi:hypothetical protein JRO89_XS05G0138300 [Xanthoceras sorbifolium]|uniref:Disease resistance RPP13-like protein 1 n=1 Tax=Xanthoceras sorbifolium TaxID=99658 RepID=A0ABQ8I1T6_9ROSI|nr:hypothetical protein JRO89_XS05G0138300 [Xanthoceras sorbifolium]